MTTVSISALKSRPSKILEEAREYPVAVVNRSKVKAYLLGKELYEKLVAYLENTVDKEAVMGANFRRGKDFKKIAKELGL